jgi:hypothetical protein
VVAHEPELDVERAVLREVPHRVVRFGAEDRAHLVDPLEDADHLLLVELRRLRQVRGPAEVVHGEHVRARLGGRPDELRRADLGEPCRVQRRPEAAQARRRDLPPRLLRGVPPGDGRMIEHRRQRGGERRPPQLDGRGLGGVGKGCDHGLRDLHPARGLRVGGDRAGHRHGGLLRRHLRRLPDAGAQHHLGEAGAVPQHEKRHGRQLTTAVDPTL